MWPLLQDLKQASHHQMYPVTYTTAQRWVVRLSLVFGYLFMITMNIVANTVKFNDTTVQDVSNQYATPITPAGYAFSIWGVIWAAVGIFVIYFFVVRTETDTLPPSVVVAFLLNCITCGLWTLLFSYKQFIISFIDILLVLASTAYLYASFFPLGISAFPEVSLAYWCRGFPWTLYLGWVSVASLVNLDFLLVAYEVGSQQVVGIVLICVAVFCIGFLFALLHDDIMVLAALIWAFVAIAVEQRGNRVIFITALTAAGVCFGLVFAIVLSYLIRKRHQHTSRPPI